MANFCNHSPITASKAHTKVGQIKKQLKWIYDMIEESKKIQYKSLYSSMSNIFIQACQISCQISCWKGSDRQKSLELGTHQWLKCNLKFRLHSSAPGKWSSRCEFMDVTLAREDGDLSRAHRVVLLTSVIDPGTWRWPGLGTVRRLVGWRRRRPPT